MIDNIAVNSQQAIIFEDDFIPINNDWQNILKCALSEIPADWDVLLLGYYYQGIMYNLAYHRPLRGSN